MYFVTFFQQPPSETQILAFDDPTPVSSPRHQPKIIKPQAKVREAKKPKAEQQVRFA